MNTDRTNHFTLCAIGALGLSLAMLAGGCAPKANSGNSGGSTAKGGATASGGSTTSSSATASGGTTASGGSTTSSATTVSGGTTTSSSTTGSGGTATSGGTTTSSITTGSGGTTTSGGTTVSGGITTSGGSSARGGTTTSGGVTTSGGSGGATVSGGTSARGGTTTSGGVTTSGGSGGTTVSGGSSARGGTTTSGGVTTSGGSGGSATGGSGGSADGGVPPITKDTALSCTYNGSTITIAAADVISDFSQTTPIMYKTTTRGQTIWKSWGPVTPETPSDPAPILTIDSTNPGPCNETGGGSLKIVATGTTQWGEGVGVNFEPDDASTPPKKGIYDAAAAGYTGVGFFAKCSPERNFVYLKVVDAPNDADVQTSSGSPPCSYSASPYCNQYGIKNVTVTGPNPAAAGGWTYYKMYFSELLQDPKTASTFGPMGGLAKNQTTAFQFQLNTPYDTNGGNPVKTPSTCWIDDVHFLKDTAPAPKTTCAAGYNVSGNKIVCGTETTARIFRGVARPSMEWDVAGWNMTPWDMDRIKNGWKANILRVGLNQAYYMQAMYAGIYPKEVARVVRWAEAAGMDVILDLHWVDGGHPSTTQGYMASVASGSDLFWKAIGTAYGSDPHVMFELYNEPTVQWSDWKTNYQALYDAVRSTAPKNIVIIGGIDWAYDLSQVISGTSTITGTNIVYNTHPYGNKAPATDWDAKFGNLTTKFPVFATEFGTYDCSGSWTQSLITYLEGKGMSWTAWSWYVAPTGMGCSSPALLSDYSGAVLNGAGSNADATFQGLKKNP